MTVAEGADEPELKALKVRLFRAIKGVEVTDAQSVAVFLMAAARMHKGTAYGLGLRASRISQLVLGDVAATDRRVTHAIPEAPARVVSAIVGCCDGFTGDPLSMSDLCILVGAHLAKACGMNRHTFMRMGATMAKEVL